MVPLPRALVARWDEARGTLSRPAFLEALLDEYDGKPPGPERAAPAAPAREPVRQGGVRPGSCPHPSSRRIGAGCGMCGDTTAHSSRRG